MMQLLWRLWRWFSLDGRIHIAQPVAFLPGPLALLVAFVTPYRWLFFVAYCYLLLVLAAYSWVRVLGPKLTLRRRLDADWAQVGDTLEEHWELANASWLPALWLEINDRSTLPHYNARRVAAAAGSTTETWLTIATCEQRGVYQLGPLLARCGDPFGLFTYQWHDDHARTIVVYPPLVRLPFQATPQGQRGGLARADLLQQHATPSVGGLREYVRGDMPSRIHWPTVARTNRLMIKEFDQDRAGALWIALDLSSAAYQNVTHPAKPAERPDVYATYTQQSSVAASNAEVQFASAVDLAIVLACSLAAAALAEGRTVGLIADDGQRRLVPPGSGQHHLWRILSSLVDAAATGDTPLGILIEQSAQTRGALAVITPALDGAWLPSVSRRGRNDATVAILIAEDTGAAQPLAVRLAAQGTMAHVFSPQVVLALLNPPRQTVAARVSPLGRLIKETA